MQRVRDILTKSESLTEDQVDLIVNKRTINSNLYHFGFMGFADTDIEYVKKAEAIYVESGVDQSIAKLQNL